MSNRIVSVREVHIRFYEVDADSDKEAKDLVADRDSSVIDNETTEYYHDLDREYWSVEEVK